MTWATDEKWEALEQEVNSAVARAENAEAQVAALLDAAGVTEDVDNGRDPVEAVRSVSDGWRLASDALLKTEGDLDDARADLVTLKAALRRDASALHAALETANAAVGERDRLRAALDELRRTVLAFSQHDNESPEWRRCASCLLYWVDNAIVRGKP